MCVSMRKESDAFGDFWAYEFNGRTWYAHSRDSARKQLAEFKASGARRDTAGLMLRPSFGRVVATWALKFRFTLSGWQRIAA